MSTYAVIENGLVINMVELGEDTNGWLPPEGCIAIETDVAGIGWTYVGGEFFPPVPEVPEPDLPMLSLIARSQRDRLLTDVYDRGISMVLRGIRMTHDDPDQLAYLEGKLAELDQYAIDLQGIPAQSGFPLTITWPSTPTE